MNTNRSIESYINLEKSEFVEFVDLREKTLDCLPWSQFMKLEQMGLAIRFPFKSELICEKEIKKEYLDIVGIHQVHDESFLNFLIRNKMKDDYFEFERQQLIQAISKWVKDKNLENLFEWNDFSNVPVVQIIKENTFTKADNQLDKMNSRDKWKEKNDG